MGQHPIELVMDVLRSRGGTLRGATIDELEKVGGKPTRRILKLLQDEGGVVLRPHSMHDRPPYAWTLVGEPDVPANWLERLVEEYSDDSGMRAHVEQMSFETAERNTRRRLDELELLSADPGDVVVTVQVKGRGEVDLFERLIFERYSAAGRRESMPSSLHFDDETKVVFRTPAGVQVVVVAAECEALAA